MSTSPLQRVVRAAALLLTPTLAFASPARAQDACALDGFAPGPRLAQDELVVQWNGEALAQAPFGAPATFDLDAVDLHVTFETGASLAAPANIVALVGDASTTWSIADAVVDGASGRLDVTGAVAVTGATVTSASVFQVDVVSGVASLRTIPEGLAAAFTGATLSGYASATLVDASGNATPLAGTVTLASAGALTRSAGVIDVRVDTVSLGGSSFALAGDFTGGTLVVDGATFATPARTILGAAGELVVDGTGVAGSGRVTQVFDDTAPLMQADVEVVVLAPLAFVSPGGSVNVPAVVRNKSAHAMAILSGIEVDGCGAAAVTPVVDEAPPSMVTVLIGVIEQSGWAAPFVAIAVAPLLGVAIVAEVFVAIADGFVDAIGDIFCGLFGCDDAEPPPTPVPPIPYPKWLAPGQVAPFEIALLPQLDEDDYPTRVRFLGNHPEAHVDFTLRVGRGDVPPTWQCGFETWGAADGCHCGCGGRDTDCPADATIASCDVDACADGFNHLEESSIDVCVRDPAPPGPTGDELDDNDDDDDDDNRFDCANASPSASWGAGLALLVALRRRAARSEPRARSDLSARR